MKKIISITLCAALLALSGCSQNTSSDVLSSDISSAASDSQSTASQEESSGLSQSGNGGFKVEGTKLLDANGKEFIGCLAGQQIILPANFLLIRLLKSG